MKVAATDRRSAIRANQRNRALTRLSLAALGVVFGFPGSTLAGAKPVATITILVYNYAQVPPGIFAAAEREAFRILDAARVRVVWVDCLEKPPIIESEALCRRGWTQQTPAVRLLSGHVTGMYQDLEFGFAAIPVLATVNYERIARRAGRDDAPYILPIILGCAMAHELGHLLLRDPGHSTTGIMQPRWGDQQTQQALTGQLRFTTPQAKLIRERALVLHDYK